MLWGLPRRGPGLTETLAVATPRDVGPCPPALAEVRLERLARAVAARGTVAHVRDARAVDMARAAKGHSVRETRQQALAETKTNIKQTFFF